MDFFEDALSRQKCWIHKDLEESFSSKTIFCLVGIVTLTIWLELFANIMPLGCCNVKQQSRDEEQAAGLTSGSLSNSSATSRTGPVSEQPQLQLEPQIQL